MGASDPSRPGKPSGPVQVLLCTLVLGGLAFVMLTSPSAEVSRDAALPVTAAECADPNEQSATASGDCDVVTSEIAEPAADPQPDMSTAPSDTQTSAKEPRHDVPRDPRTSDIREPRTDDTRARVKFSAACQSGDLREDLRCIDHRRENGLATDTPGRNGDSGTDAGLGISGRVLDQDGMGVSQIAIVATLSRTFSEESANAGGANSPDQRSVRYRTTTDSLGSYRFDDLEDGEYDIVTEALAEYPAASTSVRAGVSYADLVLVRENLIEIAGQVQSTEGEPLEGVVVLPVVLGVGSVTTDRDGMYKLPVRHDPRATSITLRFQLPGFDETYATLSAERLAGRDRIEVDARMAPVDQWTTVSGVVTSSDGAVLAGRHVRLRPNGQLRIYRATTDGNGEFIFPAVEAGVDYRLQVSGDPGYQDYDQRVMVTVDEAEFAIVVEPYEFGKVTGRMVNLDGSPVPDFSLSLKNAASSKANAVVSSDRDGNFTIDNAPAGELAFVSHATPSVLVRGVRVDPGDVVDVPLVLDWGEHEIRGLVLDHRGNPVPASRIVLKWAHQDKGISSSTTRRTAADAQGNFLFSQLGPGSHRLEIDAPGYGQVRLDHDASREGYDVLVRLN